MGRSAAVGDQGGEEKGGHQGHAVGGDVDAVHGAEADGGDEDAGQRRAGHQGQLLDGGLEGDGGGHVIGPDQHGQGGPPSRPVDALEPGAGRRAHEERPHRRMGEGGVGHQTPDGAGHGHLGQEKDLAPVPGVGQRAAPQGPGQQGHQLDQADETHDQRRMGEAVGLKGDGHQGQLGAQPGHHLARPQPAEMAVLTKGGGVDHQAGHPATVPGGPPAAGRSAAVDIEGSRGRHVTEYGGERRDPPPSFDRNRMISLRQTEPLY